MNSKERFSNRVDAYVKYRPSYPVEAIDYLYSTVGLHTNSVVADIGAGTGIFSKLLLERGSRVVAVEPNEAMRDASVKQLGGFCQFQSFQGSAEATGLADAFVDFIVCAQAFHWFDRDKAKVEFQRILKPGGKTALIWNSRCSEGTPFLELYEKLLQKYGTDYAKINHKNIQLDDLQAFFDHHGIQTARFTNNQLFDFDGVSGRLLSSSYAPAPGEPTHEAMMKELRDIFEKTQENGTVTMVYETEVFWGCLS